jgi:phosphoribosylaminoimidazole (AIR) synthetase
MGINPLMLGAAIQQQMQQIAREIARSANVGVGYAIAIDELQNEDCFRLPNT